MILNMTRYSQNLLKRSHKEQIITSIIIRLNNKDSSQIVRQRMRKLMRKVQ
jgi:hypothetical protein